MVKEQLMIEPAWSCLSKEGAELMFDGGYTSGGIAFSMQQSTRALRERGA
jgi:hypothetical protein